MFSVAALFLEAVLVARALPLEDMGVYAFFQAALALLTIGVDLGFRTTAAQLLAAEPDSAQRARLTNSLLAARLLLVAALAGPLWLSSLGLPGWLGMPRLASVLPFLPVVLLLASLDELLGGLLQGFHQYRATATSQVLRSVLRLGLTALILFALRQGLAALAVSWIVSYAMSVLQQYTALPVRRRFSLHWPTVRHVIHFGLPLQATRYLWFGMQRIDTFVLTALTGPTGVALYEVAGRLPQGLQRFAEAYFAVYHPSLASRFGRGDRAGGARLIDQSMRLFTTATLLGSWVVLLYGPGVVTLLFGERYASAGPAFVVMTLTFALGSSVNLLGFALTADTRPGDSFKINLLRSAVSLGADFLLIPYFGFIGAAYATLVSQVVTLPLAWWYLRRRGLPAHGWLFVRQVGLAAAMLAAQPWLLVLAWPARLALLFLGPLVARMLGLFRPSDLALVIPAKWLGRFSPALALGPHVSRGSDG